MTRTETQLEYQLRTYMGEYATSWDVAGIKDALMEQGITDIDHLHPIEWEKMLDDYNVVAFTVYDEGDRFSIRATRYAVHETEGTVAMLTQGHALRDKLYITVACNAMNEHSSAEVEEEQ